MRWITLLLLLCLIGLQFRVWVGERSLAEIAALEGKIEDKNVQIEVQDGINQDLRDRISDLKTGTDAIEEKARSELGLIKDDEVFVIVVESDQ